MMEVCYFSLDQWEISIHLLWGKCFNVPRHCDPHLNQTKLNGWLPLTIPGVLRGLVFWIWFIFPLRVLSAQPSPYQALTRRFWVDIYCIYKLSQVRLGIWPSYPPRHLQWKFPVEKVPTGRCICSTKNRFIFSLSSTTGNVLLVKLVNILPSLCSLKTGWK